MNKRFAKINGRDRWCVPAAISALTGWSTDVIRALIVGISWASRDPWTGVNSTDTREALAILGITGPIEDYWDQSRGYTSANPTLNQWATGRSGTYLISAGAHMLLFRDGYLVDNGSYATKQGVHYTELHHGKRARMHWSMELDDVEFHQHARPIQAADLGIGRRQGAGRGPKAPELRCNDPGPTRIQDLRPPSQHEERMKEAARRRRS